MNRLSPIFLLIPILLASGITACADPEIEPPLPLYGDDSIPYPVELWDRGIEGTTLLRIRVTDTGAVDSVEVRESSGHDDLDAAAVAGARELRFQPGRRNDRRVRMWATLPIEFSTRPRSQENRP